MHDKDDATVSENDYESLRETMHLLRSPANAKRLLESIKQADTGRLAHHALLEPDWPRRGR